MIMTVIEQRIGGVYLTKWHQRIQVYAYDLHSLEFGGWRDFPKYERSAKWQKTCLAQQEKKRKKPLAAVVPQCEGYFSWLNCTLY